MIRKLLTAPAITLTAMLVTILAITMASLPAVAWHTPFSDERSTRLVLPPIVSQDSVESEQVIEQKKAETKKKNIEILDRSLIETKKKKTKKKIVVVKKKVTPPPRISGPTPPMVDMMAQLSTSMTITPVSHIFFAHNRASLSLEAKQILDDTTDYIRLNDTSVYAIMIKSHASIIGNENYNIRLSKKRGVSIEKYFLKKGIAPAMIKKHAWGELQPQDETWTRVGQMRNRRAEIYLVELNPTL